MDITGRKKEIKFMKKIIKVIIQNYMKYMKLLKYNSSLRKIRTCFRFWVHTHRLVGGAVITSRKWKNSTRSYRVHQIPPSPCFPHFPSPPTPSTSPWPFLHSYIGHIPGAVKMCSSWKNPKILSKFTPESLWCEYIKIWMET